MVRVLSMAGVALVLSGCSLAPFEPRLASDDGGGRLDSATPDARVVLEDGSMNAREGDCTNGSDDDGDGDVDCADSDCVDYVCVPDPLDGWMGPAYPSTTGCAAASDVTLVEGGRQLRADPVSCDACQCGSPTNSRCSATLSGYSDTGCTTALGTSSISGDGTCASTSTAFQSISNLSTSATADCAVTGADPPAITDAPAHSFAERISMCWRGAGGGCGAGMRCVARPPDGAPSCVTREGDVHCPPELPSRSVLVTSVDDSRACGACRCMPTGGTCSGTIEIYGSAICTAITYSGNATSGCQSAGGARGFRYDGASASGVSCTRGGGAPDGCVAPATLSTVCCPAEAGPVCPGERGPTMVHVASSDPSFCIDSTEVTNAHYAEFLAAGVDPSMQPVPCEDDSSFEPSRDWPAPAALADHPVIGVDWCDARAYCEWAGKRLCSLIGGATSGNRMDEQDPNRSEWAHACTANGTASFDCDGSIDAVRSRPCCQIDGVHDLPGNADEWTGTCRDGFLGERCILHERDCTSADDRRRTDDDDKLGFRCCADPT